MCKITINQELNGIELSFEKKPSAAMLEEIKKQGFRWHHVKKIWYAKQTAERVTFAESLGVIEGAAAVSKDHQKELTERYMSIICADVWKDQHMQEYARKSLGYVVELANGDITDIDKPRIETSFCFGFGMYGIDPNGEGQERASKMEHHARTDQTYFINENLKDINSMIEALKDSDKYTFYKYLHYYGQPDGSKLKAVSYCRYFDRVEHNPGRWSNCRELEELTEEERAALLAGYEEVKKAFVKRLNTYLKRYGLSKLNTWTYLVD